MAFVASCSEQGGKTGSQEKKTEVQAYCDPVVNGTACPDFSCVMTHVLSESEKVAADAEGRKDTPACDAVIMVAKCKYVELVPYETQCTIKMGRFDGSMKVLTSSCGFQGGLPDSMMSLTSPTSVCDALGWDQADHNW